MKMNYHHKSLILLLFVLLAATGKIFAQDDEAPPVLLSLQYYLPANQVPYVKVATRQKIGRKFEPVKGITVKVYLNTLAEESLMNTVTTGPNGEARVAVPPALKTLWDSLDEYTFLAESVPASKEEVLDAELLVKKAILVMDTTSEDGERTVTAQLKEKTGDTWVPVNETDMKLAIKRMVGNLSVGDDEIYTSDETGTAIAPFLKDSLPGDEKGNLILIARIEDNDTYGNLVTEMNVPWGEKLITENNFLDRTLWSTGDRAPAWLLVIALSIIAGVWSTLIYLLLQLLKIRKMGKVKTAAP